MLDVLQNQIILANLILVVQILSVELITIKQHAHAYHYFSEIHSILMAANLSVLRTKIASHRKHVSILNAKTLVLALVELIRNAGLCHTDLFAHVLLITLEILTLNVENQK